MQVILLGKIINLGNIGDQVFVKNGYARNFLIPKKKAIIATKKNIEYFKELYSELEIKKSQELSVAKIRSEKIIKLNNITIFSKSGKNNKLFGSVSPKDIVRTFSDFHIDILKKEIHLPNGALRTLGNHTIQIQLHKKVLIDFIVIIKSSSIQEISKI